MGLCGSFHPVTGPINTSAKWPGAPWGKLIGEGAPIEDDGNGVHRHPGRTTMAKLVRVEPSHSTRRTPNAPPEGEGSDAGSAALTKKGKKLKEDIDNLLDEIDGILEENAKEFVASYVQRGGE